MICDLPNKILTSIFFNLTLYFMTNLRRTPGAFFTFYVFSFACLIAMSMLFRTIGSLSRTLAQAMAPAAIFILALVIYTGFVVPIRDMHPCMYSYPLVLEDLLEHSANCADRVSMDQLSGPSRVCLRSFDDQ